MSIHVVTASAGSGKTHRLSTGLVDLLLDGKAEPEGVLAITYTRKAAAELESRIRETLLAKGKTDLAGRVRDGYIGTVHSVCQRLLSEFALSVGLPPELDAMPLNEGNRLFHECLAEAVQGREAEIEAIAQRLCIEDWRTHVLEIVNLARDNARGPAELTASSKKSAESYRVLLGAPGLELKSYRSQLVAELGKVMPRLRELENDSAAALARARNVHSLQRALARGELPPWKEHMQVGSGLGNLKKLQPVVGELVALLARHSEVDAFHDDLFGMQATLFDLAARALDAFAARKAASRLVDFQDMLQRTHEALALPEVAEALQARLDVVMVDEFQDTSPIQLAIILRLAELSKRCVWVGDRKQAIFGFQGSDPELMSAAVAHALQGKKPEILDQSHRSRPALLEFTSDLFSQALAPAGFSEDEVRLKPARPEAKGLSKQPVLECWSWSSDKVDGQEQKPREATALADGVAALLGSGLLVRDRVGFNDPQTVRPVQRKDIAILARRNSTCGEIAHALRLRGIPAKVALGGLMDTPEARLARAALGLLADERDGFAALEVAYLSGGAGDDPEAWLGERMTQDLAYRAAVSKARESQEKWPEQAVPFGADPAVKGVHAARPRAQGLSPAEALDLAMDAIDLPGLCRRWPQAPQRLANLEAIRAEARGYETICRLRRSACTPLGLAEHLRLLEAEKTGLGADDSTDRQAVATDEDAVTVCTWHKCKGLEWPVVVLAELGWSFEEDVFQTAIDPAPSFDAKDPLRDRWVRFWPFPYGDIRKCALVDLARRSPQGSGLLERREREKLRLLYVGFTRARDLLVVAASRSDKQGSSIRALEPLKDASGTALLSLPFAAQPGEAKLAVAQSSWPCVRRELNPFPSDAAVPLEPARRWYDDAIRTIRPAEVLNPSTEPSPRAVAPARMASVTRLGPHAQLKASTDEMNAVGEAVHRFLAADPAVTGAPDRAAREQLARRMLDSHGVSNALAPAAFVSMGDALIAELRRRYPKSSWNREWPVRACLADEGNARLLVGEADLVLELPEGFVLVDHKSFPGSEAARTQRVLGYALQLARYTRALERALQKPLLAAFIHLPLRGELVEVDLRELLASLEVPESTRLAYEATAYHVEAAPGILQESIILRHGQSAEPLDSALARLGAQDWTFITAWNPLSKEAADNDRAQLRLRADLEAGKFTLLEGKGVGDGWPAEPSLLVLGISREDALALGRRHGQHAVVIGRAGEPARVAYCGKA